MRNDFIENIRKIIIRECQENNWMDHYKFHIEPVEKMCVKLAERYNVDKEILRIAALLHDFAIIKGLGSKDHEKIGAKIAENILKKLNYPENKSKIVVRIIKNHSGRNLDNIPLEDKILIFADKYNHFLFFLYHLSGYYCKEAKNFEKAVKWFLEKLKKDLTILERIKDLDEESFYYCKDIYKKIKPILTSHLVSL